MTEGHLAELDVSADGSSTLVSNRAFPLCLKMGEVTASPDCSVVAVLCRSESRPSDVPGSVDFVDRTLKAAPQAAFGWRNDEQPCTQTQGKSCHAIWTVRNDDSLFLLEFAGGAGTGARTDRSPTATVCVNKAIGGWPMGNWFLSLDADGGVYILDIKVTVGGQESSANLAVNRADWSFNQGMTSGWSCGLGHARKKRIFFNHEMGAWGRFCWADLCADNACKWGPMTIVSDGKQGWVGVGLGVALGADPRVPDLQKPMSVAMARLPSGSDACASAGACEWRYLTKLPGQGSVADYNNGTGILGYVNVQQIGGGSNLLVGYASSNASGSSCANVQCAPTYRVAKVSTTGAVLDVKVLSGTGWGEDNVWVRLANGCVAFPFVWAARPGGEYGSSGPSDSMSGMSNRLKVTVICDDAE